MRSIYRVFRGSLRAPGQINTRAAGFANNADVLAESLELEDGNNLLLEDNNLILLEG